jgi:hypothetical protein
MGLLLTISALATTIAVVAFILHDALIRKNNILSYRNFFLLGFIFFYGVATAFLMILADGSGEVYTPEGSGFGPLAVLIPTFVLFFAFAWKIGHKWNWTGKVIPKVELPVNTPGIMIGIAALLGVAALGLAAPTSYLGGVFTQMRPGLAASAAGLATYFLLAQIRNPIAWAVFAATFVFASLLSVAGGTDRRFVLGVFIVVVWVWYYHSLRFRPILTTVTKLGVLGAVATMFIILYSGIRHAGEARANIGARAEQLVTALADPTVSNAALNQVLYQDAPVNTIYIIESYPRDNALDPFNGILFFLSNPIPRFFWPDKPVGLGYALQQQFNIAANLGPGIIGHGWAEGMWFGVIGYALFFGILVGVLDRLIRDRATNPYYVAVMGSFMGNFIALPRGETSLFGVLIVTGVVGSLGILWLVNTVLGPALRAFTPLVIPIPGVTVAPSADTSDTDGHADNYADADFNALNHESQFAPADQDTGYIDRSLAGSYGQPGPVLDYGEHR